MIKRISFKNYKIFKEKQSLEIKPITIVFGKNNSGKSVVSKLPILLSSSIKAETNAVLSVNNNDIAFGTDLKDLVYGKANRAIEFELESENQEHLLCLKIYIANEKTRQISKIEQWKLDSGIDLTIDEGGQYIDQITGKPSNVKFHGFQPIGDLSQSVNLIDLFAFETDYIGPIRIVPMADYRQNTTIDLNKSGIKGEYAYQQLISDALTTNQKIITEVAGWYQENFEGWALRINQDRAPVFQVEIERENLRQNITDAGIGMSQVLPIITRSKTQCINETLIVIEEPETHLHPAAHANLAELFFTSRQEDPNKFYLIETHSLNLILRLRRLVAEKKLSKNDLAIYYVDFLKDKNCSELKRINVDELGQVDFWPENVFNETLQETIAIRTAQTHTSHHDN